MEGTLTGSFAEENFTGEALSERYEFSGFAGEDGATGGDVDRDGVAPRSGWLGDLFFVCR